MRAELARLERARRKANERLGAGASLAGGHGGAVAVGYSYAGAGAGAGAVPPALPRPSLKRLRNDEPPVA
jgi:hypothetical protein